MNMNKWLYAVGHDQRLRPASFKLAWWITMAIDGDHLNLSEYERQGLGHRRTAQRSLNDLIWAGYLKVERRNQRGPGRYGCNTYELTMPERKMRRAA
jgi:hypothetical protein